MTDHSYEEIRAVAIELLAGRESATITFALNQYEHLKLGVATVFHRRETTGPPTVFAGIMPIELTRKDSERFLEVFWGLFREGLITLGCNDSNRNFPFFRVSEFGLRLLQGGQPYFFHDVSGYEGILRREIPRIDEVTLLYLKEAMQAFKAGCILSATVMLGVATEHTFLLLLEQLDANPAHARSFERVGRERTILGKINRFREAIDQQVATFPQFIKEDLDTNFAGIQSVIRNFRNQSGHPTGTIIDREQAYVLLQLFVPYGKKMYQLIEHFS